MLHYITNMKKMYNVAAAVPSAGAYSFTPATLAGSGAPQTKDYAVTSDAPREGYFSFNAMVFAGFGERAAGPNSRNFSILIAPFGLAELVHGYPDEAPSVPVSPSERRPLYEPLTADGQAIRANYKLWRKEPEGTSRKKVIEYIPIASRNERMTAVLANGRELTIGVLVGNGVNFVMPRPGTPIRVVDFAFATGKDGSGCFCNAGDIRTSGFDDLNALSLSDRLSACFPAVHQDLPDLDPLIGLRPYLLEVSENGLDRGQVNKARNNRIKDLGAPPMTMTRVAQSQAWSLSDMPQDPFAAPLVLPVRGFPDDPAKGVYGYNLENSRSMYTPGDKDAGKFRFQMSALALAPGQRRFRLHEIMIWPRSFATLGIAYPTFIEALLRYHPIPFQMMLATDLGQTLLMQDNLPDQRPTAFPSGIIVPNVELVAFETESYVERYGIPVPESLVRARYGLRGTNTIKPKYNEDKPAGAVGIRDFFTLPPLLKLENAYDAADSFTATGFAALDGGCEHEIPDDAVEFRMLAAFSLSGEVKKAPRADPFVSDPAEDLPLAVAMTAEEGEALVVRNLPGERLPADPKGWMMDAGGGRLVPRFFFFMLKKRTPQEVADRVAAFHDTIAALTKPVPALETLNLPANLNEWRAKNIKFEDATAAKKRPLNDAVPPPVAASSPKQARSEDDEFLPDEAF